MPRLSGLLKRLQISCASQIKSLDHLNILLICNHLYFLSIIIYEYFNSSLAVLLISPECLTLAIFSFFTTIVFLFLEKFPKLLLLNQSLRIINSVLLTVQNAMLQSFFISAFSTCNLSTYLYWNLSTFSYLFTSYLIIHKLLNGFGYCFQIITTAAAWLSILLKSRSTAEWNNLYEEILWVLALLFLFSLFVVC